MPGPPRRVAWRRLAPAATILVLASALPGVDPLTAIRAEESRAARARDGEEAADKDRLRWLGAMGDLALGDEPDDPYDPYARIDEPWPTSAGGTGLAAGEAGPDGEVDAGGLPDVALQAYLRAERALGLSDPDCGLQWPLLAAIGRVESDHGRYGGSILDEDGNGSRPIRGIALDGRDGVARIADTDGGELDGDRTYDRAVGPMQFIPGTWARVSVDANADGVSDPDNIYDAALAAAVYLCAGGADLTTEEGREAAVLRYNHSEAYVRTVLRLADAYARGETGTLPDPGPLPGDVPSIDSPLLPPANVDSPSDPPAPVVIPAPTPPAPPAGSGSDSGSDSGGEVAGGTTTTTTRPTPTSTTTTTRPAPTSTTTTTRPAPTSTTTTAPPTTAPPTTVPPTTVPPTTVPPTTVPPTTVPPTTVPPTTVPPTTVPPAPVDTCDPATPAGLTWTGQLPSGLYTLELRGTVDEACLSLALPAGVRPTAEGTPDALTGAWRVSSADGRHVVWGLAPSDVTEVVVGITTPDGAASEVRAATLPPGPAGITHRAFALVLPECTSITSLMGVGAAGPHVTATDLSALAAVAGYDPTVTATVPVG